MGEYGVENCIDAFEGVREALDIVRLIMGIGVMAIEPERTT